MKEVQRMVLFWALFTMPIFGVSSVQIDIDRLANNLADDIKALCDNPAVTVIFFEPVLDNSAKQNSFKDQLLRCLKNRMPTKAISWGECNQDVASPNEHITFSISAHQYYQKASVYYNLIVIDSENKIPGTLTGKLTDQSSDTLADVGSFLKNIWVPLLTGLCAVVYYIFIVRANRKSTYAKVADSIISKFNEKELIEARGSIYKQNLIFINENDYISRYDSLLHRDLDIVLSSFDVAGMLVVRKLVPKEYLLPVYWAPTIMSWYKLRPYIKYVKWSRYSLANVHFVALAKKSLEYWTDNCPECVLMIENYESGKAKDLNRIELLQHINIDVDSLRQRISWWEHHRLFKKDAIYRRFFRAFLKGIRNVKA